MIKEKNEQDSNVFDFEKIFETISGYVEYCIKTPKTKITDKEKEGLLDSEIEKKEEKLKFELKKFNKKKNNFDKQFKDMCKFVTDGGISYLTDYVDALKKLCETKSDWKKYIKSMLVSENSLKLFKYFRNNMDELYLLLIRVNEIFSVDDYSELSISPNAALYGSKVNVNKSKVDVTKRCPLQNQDIQNILEAFLDIKNNKLFGDWAMEILCFNYSQIIDAFQEEYIPKREQLKDWLYHQINSEERYKQAVIQELLKSDKLKCIISDSISYSEIKKKHDENIKKIKQLEEKYDQEKIKNTELLKNQGKLNEQKEEDISKLNQQLRDFDHCKQQLSDYAARYQAQVEINEIITADSISRLKKITTEYDNMQDELTDANKRLDTLEEEHLALQSDYSLKSNELLNFKKSIAQKESIARNEVIKELISGINEQIYYLTMFYIELRDTGKLEPESIELYSDTLKNIDCVLDRLGIKKIGVIDQKVNYDTSIYNATDAKIANGEQVLVRGYGWKIGNDIYIKAPVEKGE